MKLQKIAELRRPENELEDEARQVVSNYIFDMYFGALEGWAPVEPKAASKSFYAREGDLGKSLVVYGYGHVFYRMLFEHLSKVDADFAFTELTKLRIDDFEEGFGEMNIASMLAGYLRGAPRGRDWLNELNFWLKQQWNRGYVYAEIRVALTGRWLEDDPDSEKLSLLRKQNWLAIVRKDLSDLKLPPKVVDLVLRKLEKQENVE